MLAQAARSFRVFAFSSSSPLCQVNVHPVWGGPVLVLCGLHRANMWNLHTAAELLVSHSMQFERIGQMFAPGYARQDVDVGGVSLLNGQGKGPVTDIGNG